MSVRSERTEAADTDATLESEVVHREFLSSRGRRVKRDEYGGGEEDGHADAEMDVDSGKKKVVHLVPKKELVSPRMEEGGRIPPPPTRPPPGSSQPPPPPPPPPPGRPPKGAKKEVIEFEGQEILGGKEEEER